MYSLSSAAPRKNRCRDLRYDQFVLLLSPSSLTSLSVPAEVLIIMLWVYVEMYLRSAEHGDGTYDSLCPLAVAGRATQSPRNDRTKCGIPPYPAPQLGNNVLSPLKTKRTLLARYAGTPNILSASFLHHPIIINIIIIMLLCVLSATTFGDLHFMN